MWFKMFLNTFQNDRVRSCLSLLGDILMVIAILFALLTMDPQEISFVYANF